MAAEMDPAQANRISMAMVIKKQKGVQNDNAAEGQLCPTCKKFKHKKVHVDESASSAVRRPSER